MPYGSYPATQYFTSAPWSDKPIHSERPVKIICAGAGASGLLFAYKLQRSFENVDLTIYEKNEDIGGTWFENRYPGCACDIAAHAYTWSFEPNPNWSSTYASSDEICSYFSRFADKYGLWKYCHFKKRISRAEWDNDSGQWNVEITDVDTGSVTQDWCHFFINACGILNAWKWPDIPGLDKFEGKLVHSANYDRNIDLTDKTVALIGNGSSAIQILPAILPKTKKVVNFCRSAAYVLPNVFQSRSYTDEEKATFVSDPKKLEDHRRQLDSHIIDLFSVFLKDSPLQKTLSERLRAAMAAKLKGSGLEDKLIPDWGVGCKRLTPGVGYLEALIDPKTEVVLSGVKEITAKGCVSDGGEEYAVDVIICATGFDTSCLPKFPIIGQNGVPITEAWEEEPINYLSFAAPGFPNYFIFGGPNSPIGNGPYLITLEAQADYMLKMINRYQTENIHSFSPKLEAVQDFMAYKDMYMKRTIWEGGCRSWYKSGPSGKITALWPGSSPHFLETLNEPRYEDWNYTYVGGNRFGYLGNGHSQTEMDRTADWSYYLRDVDDSPFIGRAKRRKVETRSGTIKRLDIPENAPKFDS